MTIEVYIPEHEVGVIGKVLELKEKRKLSGYIVELLKKEDEVLTKEQVIELIKQYGGAGTGNTSKAAELEDTIQSILGGF